MNQLLDLPNELLLDIINVVAVEDTEAFTSCNKRIYALSHDVLQKYRAMKMKYSTVRCTTTESSRSVMDVHLHVHPVVWLYEIILDKTIASYPTRLIIHGTRRDFFDRRIYPGLDARIGNVTDQIHLKLDQCPYIQPQDLDYWKRFNNFGGFDNALALLLTLLPNLQFISVGGFLGMIHSTQYMLSKIAEAHQKSSQNSHPLSRLVSIDRLPEADDYLPSKEFNFYLALTAFASVRSICGHRVDGRVVHGHGRTDWTALSHMYPPSWANLGVDFKSMLKTSGSKTTEIKFSRSNISSDSFEDLFGRISALQVFEYKYFPHPTDGHGKFELCNIVGSLLAHASHSLVYFDLTMDIKHYDERAAMVYVHGEIFIGSLRGFRVLKTIRANNTMFIEKVAPPEIVGRKVCKIHRLVDLLPESIEELHLVQLQVTLDMQSSGIFDGLVELKARNLPSLKAINLDYFDPVAPDLKAAFAHEVGVDFNFIPKGMMDK